MVLYKYTLRYIHCHMDSQNQMVLAVKEAEISPCLGQSVMAHALQKRLSRRKEWCCGQDSGTAPSRGQYSRAATLLIAVGSFVEDVLVHVSASELSLGRWAQGGNSLSNLFASWPRFPSFPSLQSPKAANTTKPFAFILLPFIQTLLTPHLFPTAESLIPSSFPVLILQQLQHPQLGSSCSVQPSPCTLILFLHIATPACSFSSCAYPAQLLCYPLHSLTFFLTAGASRACPLLIHPLSKACLFFW